MNALILVVALTPASLPVNPDVEARAALALVVARRERVARHACPCGCSCAAELCRCANQTAPCEAGCTCQQTPPAPSKSKATPRNGPCPGGVCPAPATSPPVRPAVLESRAPVFHPRPAAIPAPAPVDRQPTWPAYPTRAPLVPRRSYRPVMFPAAAPRCGPRG